MLSKNNFKEKIRQIEEKKERFSIRKLTIGAVSVLLGFTFMGMQAQAAQASEVQESGNSVDVKTEQVKPDSENLGGGTKPTAGKASVTLKDSDNTISSKEDGTAKAEVKSSQSIQTESNKQDKKNVDTNNSTSEAKGDKANAGAISDSQKNENKDQAVVKNDKGAAASKNNKNEEKVENDKKQVVNDEQKLDSNETKDLNNTNLVKAVDSLTDILNKANDIAASEDFSTKYTAAAQANINRAILKAQTLLDRYNMEKLNGTKLETGARDIPEVGTNDKSRTILSVDDYSQAGTNLNGLIAQFYAASNVQNGVVEVSNTDELSQALNDENHVNTIRLNSDLSINNGIDLSHGHKVTIEGNNHGLNFSTYNGFNFNGNNSWDLTLDKVKINCNNRDAVIFKDNTSGLFFNNITFKNTTFSIIGRQTVDSSTACLLLNRADNNPSWNVTFKGDNTVISGAGYGFSGGTFDANKIVIDQGSSLKYSNAFKDTTALKANDVEVKGLLQAETVEQNSCKFIDAANSVNVTGTGKVRLALVHSYNGELINAPKLNFETGSIVDLRDEDSGNMLITSDTGTSEVNVGDVKYLNIQSSNVNNDAGFSSWKFNGTTIGKAAYVYQSGQNIQKGQATFGDGSEDKWLDTDSSTPYWDSQHEPDLKYNIKTGEDILSDDATSLSEVPTKGYTRVNGHFTRIVAGTSILNEENRNIVQQDSVKCNATSNGKHIVIPAGSTLSGNKDFEASDYVSVTNGDSYYYCSWANALYSESIGFGDSSNTSSVTPNYNANTGKLSATFLQNVNIAHTYGYDANNGKAYAWIRVKYEDNSEDYVPVEIDVVKPTAQEFTKTNDGVALHDNNAEALITGATSNNSSFTPDSDFGPAQVDPNAGRTKLETKFSSTSDPIKYTWADANGQSLSQNFWKWTGTTDSTIGKQAYIKVTWGNEFGGSYLVPIMVKIKSSSEIYQNYTGEVTVHAEGTDDAENHNAPSSLSTASNYTWSDQNGTHTDQINTAFAGAVSSINLSNLGIDWSKPQTYSNIEVPVTFSDHQTTNIKVKFTIVGYKANSQEASVNAREVPTNSGNYLEAVGSPSANGYEWVIKDSTAPTGYRAITASDTALQNGHGHTLTNTYIKVGYGTGNPQYVQKDLKIVSQAENTSDSDITVTDADATTHYDAPYDVSVVEPAVKIKKHGTNQDLDYGHDYTLVYGTVDEHGNFTPADTSVSPFTPNQDQAAVQAQVQVPVAIKFSDGSYKALPTSESKINVTVDKASAKSGIELNSGAQLSGNISDSEIGTYLDNSTITGSDHEYNPTYAWKNPVTASYDSTDPNKTYDAIITVTYYQDAAHTQADGTQDVTIHYTVKSQAAQFSRGEYTGKFTTHAVTTGYEDGQHPLADRNNFTWLKNGNDDSDSTNFNNAIGDPNTTTHRGIISWVEKPNLETPNEDSSTHHVTITFSDGSQGTYEIKGIKVSGYEGKNKQIDAGDAVPALNEDPTHDADYLAALTNNGNIPAPTAYSPKVLGWATKNGNTYNDVNASDIDTSADADLSNLYIKVQYQKTGSGSTTNDGIQYVKANLTINDRSNDFNISSDNESQTNALKLHRGTLDTDYTDRDAFSHLTITKNNSDGTTSPVTANEIGNGQDITSVEWTTKPVTTDATSDATGQITITLKGGRKITKDIHYQVIGATTDATISVGNQDIFNNPSDHDDPDHPAAHVITAKSKVTNTNNLTTNNWKAVSYQWSDAQGNPINMGLRAGLSDADPSKDGYILVKYQRKVGQNWVDDGQEIEHVTLTLHTQADSFNESHKNLHETINNAHVINDGTTNVMGVENSDSTDPVHTPGAFLSTSQTFNYDGGSGRLSDLDSNITNITWSTNEGEKPDFTSTHDSANYTAIIHFNDGTTTTAKITMSIYGVSKAHDSLSIHHGDSPIAKDQVQVPTGLDGTFSSLSNDGSYKWVKRNSDGTYTDMTDADKTTMFGTVGSTTGYVAVDFGDGAGRQIIEMPLTVMNDSDWFNHNYHDIEAVNPVKGHVINDGTDTSSSFISPDIQITYKDAGNQSHTSTLRGIAPTATIKWTTTHNGGPNFGTPSGEHEYQAIISFNDANDHGSANAKVKMAIAGIDHLVENSKEVHHGTTVQAKDEIPDTTNTDLQREYPSISYSWKQNTGTDAHPIWTSLSDTGSLAANTDPYSLRLVVDFGDGAGKQIITPFSLTVDDDSSWFNHVIGDHDADGITEHVVKNASDEHIDISDPSFTINHQTKKLSDWLHNTDFRVEWENGAPNLSTAGSQDKHLNITFTDHTETKTPKIQVTVVGAKLQNTDAAGIKLESSDLTGHGISADHYADLTGVTDPANKWNVDHVAWVDENGHEITGNVASGVDSTHREKPATLRVFYKRAGNNDGYQDFPVTLHLHQTADDYNVTAPTDEAHSHIDTHVNADVTIAQNDLHNYVNITPTTSNPALQEGTDYTLSLGTVPNDISTSKSSNKNLTITVTFTSDQSTKTVEIPVHVYGATVKTDHDNPHGIPVSVFKGDLPTNTQADNDLHYSDGHDDASSINLNAWKPKVINWYSDQAGQHLLTTTNTSDTTLNSAWAEVQYSDGKTEMVNIPLKITESDAQQYHDSLSGKAVTVLKSGTELSGFSIPNMVSDHNAVRNGTVRANALSGLPTNVQASVEWASPVDISSVGDKNALIKITYGQDHSVDYVATTVHVVSLADVYTPVGQDVTVEHNNNPLTGDATDAIANTSSMPDGTSYSWNDPVDISVIGSTVAGVVRVSFSDGSSTTVGVNVHVIGTQNPNNQASIFDPQGKDITKHVGDAITNDDAKDAIANKATDPVSQYVSESNKLPADVTISWTNDMSHVTETTGDKAAIVKVTYSDNSVDEVPIIVHVLPKNNNANSDHTTPLGQDITKHVGDTLTNTDARDAITNFGDLANAENASFEALPPMDANGKLTTVGDYAENIKITYHDGSTKLVGITVHVLANHSDEPGHTSDADVITAVGKTTERQMSQTDVLTDGDYTQNSDAKDGITFTFLAGKSESDVSSLTWVDTDFKNDALKSEGLKTGQVLVTYGDGTTAIVAVRVLVTSEASRTNWTGKTINAHVGDTVEPSLGVEQALPAGASVSFVTPAADIDSQGKAVAVGTYGEAVKLSFSDGSSKTLRTTMVVTDPSSTIADRVNAVGGEITKHIGDTLTTDDAKNEIINNGELANVIASANPYTWANAPSTTSEGLKNGVVKINFKDGSSKDVAVLVNVISYANDPAYAPIGQDVHVDSPRTIKLGQNDHTEHAQDGIQNASSLASVVSDGQNGHAPAYQWLSPVDISHADRSVPGIIKVTYKDGSSRNVAVNVIVGHPSTGHADQAEPQAKVINAHYGDLFENTEENAKKGIANVSDLPSGAHYSFDDSTLPVDSQHKINQTGDIPVIIKISGNNYNKTVETIMHIVSDAQEHNGTNPAKPAPIGQNITTTVGDPNNKVTPENGISNHGAMTDLANTNPYTWEDAAPDVSTAGTKSATIKVTYADGSFTEVPISVIVTDNSGSHSGSGQRHDTDDINPFGKTIEKNMSQTAILSTDDAKNATDGISQADQSKVDSYEWVDPSFAQNALKTSGYHQGQIRVTYHDGSDDIFMATVHVTSDADRYNPLPEPIQVDPNHVDPHDPNVPTDPSDPNNHTPGVDPSTVPDGTHTSWPVDPSGNPIVPTDPTPGDHPTNIVVHFPDGSEITIPTVNHIPNPAAPAPTPEPQPEPQPVPTPEPEIDDFVPSPAPIDHGIIFYNPEDNDKVVERVDDLFSGVSGTVIPAKQVLEIINQAMPKGWILAEGFDVKAVTISNQMNVRIPIVQRRLVFVVGKGKNKKTIKVVEGVIPGKDGEIIPEKTMKELVKKYMPKGYHVTLTYKIIRTMITDQRDIEIPVTKDGEDPKPFKPSKKQKHVKRAKHAKKVVKKSAKKH